MIFTEDFIRTAVTNYDALSSRIREVAIEIENLQGGTQNASDDYRSFEIEIEENRVCGNFEYYCCGSSEYDYCYFPLEYLWTENYLEIEKARLEAEKEANRVAAEQKRLADEEQKRLEREERDRRDYERLRKKFGE